jgi:hypothetical protein
VVEEKQTRGLIFLAMAAAVVNCVLPATAQSTSVHDLPILTGIELETGLTVGINTATGNVTWLSNDGSSLMLQYPGGQYTLPPSSSRPQASGPQPNFGFALIYPGQGPGPVPIPPSGSRVGQDVSGYQGLVLRMRSDSPMTVGIAIKDSLQGDDGTETKVLVTLSQQWQTYYIPLSWFIGVDLKRVYFLTEFIFNGTSQQTLHVSQIDYTTQPPATGKILPHFIYGGGWSTTLYFTNSSGATVSFPISFFGADGSPLQVPTPGDGSMAVGLTILLAPRATSVVEFPMAGGISTTGYVLAMLPADISGYALLKRSVSGQADQEVAVPFSGTSATSSTLIFDETNSVTSAFIVNSSNSDANVSILAWSVSGQSLGEGSFLIPARSKQTLVLRSLLGLSGVAGQKGSVDFIVGSDFVQSSGNIAVLTLNSEGAALISIPTSDK